MDHRKQLLLSCVISAVVKGLGTLQALDFLEGKNLRRNTSVPSMMALRWLKGVHFTATRMDGLVITEVAVRSARNRLTIGFATNPVRYAGALLRRSGKSYCYRVPIRKAL